MAPVCPLRKPALKKVKVNDQQAEVPKQGPALDEELERLLLQDVAQFNFDVDDDNYSVNNNLNYYVDIACDTQNVEQLEKTISNFTLKMFGKNLENTNKQDVDHDLILVPLALQYGNESILVHAEVDSGAKVTFIDSSLVTELRLPVLSVKGNVTLAMRTTQVGGR